MSPAVVAAAAMMSTRMAMMTTLVLIFFLMFLCRGLQPSLYWVRRALEYELRVGRDLFKCILELL
jgi:hypothetical protein